MRDLARYARGMGLVPLTLLLAMAAAREGARAEGAPGGVTLLAPTGVVTAPHPTFSWTQAPGATWYQVWLGRDWEYHHSEWTQNPGWTAWWNMQTYPGNYQWWVQTWNSAGYGPWSGPLAFSIDASGTFHGWWATRDSNPPDAGDIRAIQEGQRVYAGWLSGTVSGNALDIPLGAGGYRRATLAADGNSFTGTYHEYVEGAWRTGTMRGARLASPGRMTVGGTVQGQALNTTGEAIGVLDRGGVPGGALDDIELHMAVRRVTVEIELEDAEQLLVGNHSVGQGFHVNVAVWTCGGIDTGWDALMATSGSVNISRYDTRLVGSYSLTLVEGSAISGVFNVPLCDPLAVVPAP